MNLASGHRLDLTVLPNSVVLYLKQCIRSTHGDQLKRRSDFSKEDLLLIQGVDSVIINAALVLLQVYRDNLHFVQSTSVDIYKH